MNGVELARQTAASLHAKAVEIGVDCWQPYAFAVAEAARIDLDVESTAVDAPILNGGRAVFIPSDRLILHERVGTPFEQAFLVAHEIGHALLGDDADEGLEVEIDPVRAAEPPAVGTERVVDYGHRQRREIQMDLFAREFLLPRYFVRRLHLEDGLSASAIAAKIGAPFAVVAQQLLDALLLPSIEPEEKKVGPELPPNDLQRAAIQHRGAAYLLEAGPGTGKTQTLTARVTSLLAEGVDPRRILLLTFSNKAAREMADRISAKSKDAAGAMWIGTFHAFGLDLNYFLTDAFSVGLQGSYYIKQLTERETNIGLQYNRIPTLNRYLWNASLHFGPRMATLSPLYGSRRNHSKLLCGLGTRRPRRGLRSVRRGPHGGERSHRAHPRQAGRASLP